MPNSLGPDGLTTKTQAEYISDFRAAFEIIYGEDINLDQDSPDGQMMMIFIQAILDVLDLLTQIYNSFDPDTAVGVQLDERCAINGIERQAGTHTSTNITVTVSQALTLYGLDQSENPVYTIADNAGNEWVLVETQSPSASGVYVYQFISKIAGAVSTIPNTITVPVTIVLGVTSVNNPTTYTTLGINEESDAALRIRRQKSVSIASQGYLAGLLAALEDVSGVTSAVVHENNTDATDGDGVPSHSIWVIISGSPEPANVAQAIYAHRNAGCGMFGEESYTITQADGSPFIIYWDVVSLETLYIKFTATSIDGINPPNIQAIREQLPDLLKPGVFEEVDITHLGALVQEIDRNCLVTDAGFSLSPTGPFTDTLTPSTKKDEFDVLEENIIITPMILSPVNSVVQSGGTQQFSAFGGFGAYTFSIDDNQSGGTIDSGTGLYTAGPTTGVEDIIKVVDDQANEAFATVTVP